MLKIREANKEDLETIAEKAVEKGNLGVLTSIGKEEALQILHDAY